MARSLPLVLLVLPTGTYRAEEYLAAAERLGVDIVIGSERAQALAGVMGDRFVELPLDEPVVAADRILEHLRRLAAAGAGVPTAVVSVDDQGSLAAALAARGLGLRHSRPEAVALTRDKAAMRACFDAAAVAQPAYAVAAPTPVAVSASAGRIGFPVVVKPRTLSGSRGVIRADSPAEASAATERIAAIRAEAGEAQDSPLLVERFVPGPEVAVEGILADGQLEIIAVFDKPDPLDGPYFEETLYVSPSRLAGPLLASVAAETAAAVAALGLTEGPVHAELRVPGALGGALDGGGAAAGGEGASVAGGIGSAGGHWKAGGIESAGGRGSAGPGWTAGGIGSAGGSGPAGGSRSAGSAAVSVLEVAARTIGGRCSKAIVLEDGSSLEELVLATALGIDRPPARLRHPAGILMIPIPSSGRLRAVGGIEAARSVPGITGVEITIPIGRPVRALPEGDRYLGFVFAAGESAASVEAALRAAQARLEVDIALGSESGSTGRRR